MKEGAKDSVRSQSQPKNSGSKNVKKKSAAEEPLSHDFTLKLLRDLENRPTTSREQGDVYPSTSLPGVQSTFTAATRKNKPETENEALHEINQTLAATLTKYSSLYDLAPSAFVTIDRSATIRKLNLEASKLLGKNRSGLTRLNFRHFICSNSYTRFDEFLQKAFETKTKQKCFIHLNTQTDPSSIFLVEGLVTADSIECQLTIVGIPGSRYDE